MTVHFDIPLLPLAGELILYFLFALALRDAWRRGRGYPGELLGGVAFGLLLEYVNVTFITGYHYRIWIIMFGPIPLAVALGWGTIMYGAMLTSDRLGLPAWAAPFLDTLLALNIDLAMDAVAIRLGLWVWEWPPQFGRWTAQWFGVPYANFFGWLLVVLLYSGLTRLLRAYGPRLPALLQRARVVLFPALAVALSEIVLFLILAHTNFETPFLALLLGLIGFSLVLVFVGAQRRRPQALPGMIALAVPFYYHAYFLLALIGPLPHKQDVLYVVSGSMAVIGLVVHLWPERARIATFLCREPLGAGEAQPLRPPAE